MFHQAHKQRLPDWQIRLLNKTTVLPYLAQIPYYEGDLDLIGYYRIQHKSDYVRLLLISYYGGVWMDMSTFFVENLEWLRIENLVNNPDVQNIYHQKPDVLLFTSSWHGSKELYFQKNKKRMYQISPGYEIWFIAAQPNSTFIKEYLYWHRRGMFNNMQITQGNQNYMSIIGRQNNITMGNMKNIAYLTSMQSIQYIIQNKQQQLDKIHGVGDQRQLAVWYYKLWHIKSIKGPYAVAENVQNAQTNILARYSLAQLQKFNIRIRYFVKLFTIDRNDMKLYSFQGKEGNNLEEMVEILEEMDQFVAQKYFCAEQYQVYEQSVLYQYLLKDSTLRNNYVINNGSFIPIFSCNRLEKFVGFVKQKDYKIYLKLTSEVLRIIYFVFIGLLTLIFLVYVKFRYELYQLQKDSGFSK